MIQASGVRKRFGQQCVLRGVNLEVAVGQVVTICGASGSGKSTLLRLIAGLDVVDSGEIRLGGVVVSEVGRTDPPESRGIGMLFQEALLWPHMTVAGNIAFPLGGLPRAKIHDRVASLLDAADLAHIATKRPHQLSGGEARRVALLRAIAAAPPILLLDEPLAHLDPASRDTMLELLMSHREETHPAVIWVSHELGAVPHVGSRSLQLHKGQLIHVDQ